MVYYDRLPAKFCHPKDLAQNKAAQHQRDRERQDLAMGPGRVYAVIGETRADAETSDVTPSSNSAIVWNPVTKHWEMCTPENYGRKLDSTKAAKVVRLVRAHSQNRQAGGSW